MDPEDLDLYSKGLSGIIEQLGPIISFLGKLIKLPLEFIAGLPMEYKLFFVGIFAGISILFLRYFVINYDEIVFDLME